jgi:nicotinamidase/pyrazinamidase
MPGTLLWDVDTQVDFMEPSGKLYVPGAGELSAGMERLVDAARSEGIVHVASADDHELTDPELSEQPDYESTYPPHCLRGTRGAEKIAATKQRDPLPLSLVPFPPAAVARLVRGCREVLLLKKSFDVFTNPNVEPLLETLDPDAIVVFGVAIDVCDDAAIRGFLRRGRRVRFVEDAARGLDEARVLACTQAWRAAGVEFTTVEEVIAAFG